MVDLAFIWHMHQPYYKDIITGEFYLPWVRLHGIKDYLDMVKILEGFPNIRQTFNIVPSLFEQIDDYVFNAKTDRFFQLSYKEASNLTDEEKRFILDNFFSADIEKMIRAHPRFYELYIKRTSGHSFTEQEILDTQVCFNLAWLDPSFRFNIPELKKIVGKGRFFTEEEKRIVLDKQLQILKEITPTYKKFFESGQIEITITPYYHPIMPLLFDIETAKEANPKIDLPDEDFTYPEDLTWHIQEAVKFYQGIFGKMPSGMWPSEEAVSEKILPFIMQAGIKWIVTDETILFKSLKKEKSLELLYHPYTLNRKEGDLNIIFRDSELSNLIGFVYQEWPTNKAIDDFVGRLQNIAVRFKNKDILVTVALDGENAWEYYKNDGIDFLRGVYGRLSEDKSIKTITVTDALNKFDKKEDIPQLAAGSWIFGNFDKWIGSEEKNLAWSFLTKARKLLETKKLNLNEEDLKKAWQQIYIAEGSDWFWWYGNNHKTFEELYKRHLENFYKILKEPVPDYLSNNFVNVVN